MPAEDEMPCAHRTAFAAVKHTFERVGDHWEAMDELVEAIQRADERETRKAR